MAVIQLASYFPSAACLGYRPLTSHEMLTSSETSFTRTSTSSDIISTVKTVLAWLLILYTYVFTYAHVTLEFSKVSRKKTFESELSSVTRAYAFQISKK